MIRNFFQLSQRSSEKGINEREKIIAFFFDIAATDAPLGARKIWKVRTIVL